MKPGGNVLTSQSQMRPVDARTEIAAGDNARIARVVEEYLAALEKGDCPNREKFLSRHADMADALGECLDALEFVHVTAGQLQLERDDEDAATNTRPQLGVVGEFRIVREIGRGGMGVVYEAEQRSLGRRVALKVLPFAAMLDKKQLARFQNEARAAATLDHPNIVHVYSVGSERGVHFYAMQLIEGKSLAEVIGEIRKSEVGSRKSEAGNRMAARKRRLPTSEFRIPI